MITVVTASEIRVMCDVSVLPMLRIKRLFHSLPIAHGVQVSPQNDDHIRMRSLEINKNILSLPFSIIILFRFPHR
jgi:hypothetical protein